MAVSFPFSIATNLLTKIASPAFKELCRSSGLQTGIRNLEKTVSNLEADLLIAEEHQAQHPQLRDWLAELSDLLYDAEDALDELECKALRRQVLNTAGSYESNMVITIIRSFKKIPRKINNIEEKSRKMAAYISRYLNQRNLSRVYSRDRVINHLFGGANQVFGREMDKENIIDLLMRPNDVQNENISVISIVGIEGLGKTTLAKMVYTDERIDELFELKLWVRVPEDFCITRLMKACYTSATGTNYDEVEEYNLACISATGTNYDEVEDYNLACISATGTNYDEVEDSNLARILEGMFFGKKFLLVLDHVFIDDENTWDCLKKDLLLKGAGGSKVLVTTRKEHLLVKVDHSYSLSHLSHENSNSLFVRSTFRDGEDIVKQCDGIPLVVKTAATLRYQNTDESHWSLIKDNSIWTLKQKDKILQVLKLSYVHLSSHLQRCLAYCALFPKGYQFNSNCVISYWMAAGYLVPREENEESEDVGLQYLKELHARCFFQDVEDHDYYFTFQMHDVVHDFIVEVAQRECKTVDLRIGYDDINARHLSILEIQHENPEVSFISRKLQTIIIRNVKCTSSWESFINKCISNFGYLRLLSLSNVAIENLPDSIGTLKLLRFLDLCWNFIMKELSEAICELQSLQTLRLLGCSKLQNLPNKMRNMISLRYLEITTQERQLPQSNGIEYLSSLRYLHLYDCHNLESLPDRMQSLTSLQTLILQGCGNLISLPRSIADLVRLEKLVIHSCKNLNLKMDKQGRDGPLKLQVFMIYELEELVDLPQLILQGRANTLEYMKIEACPKLTTLPAWLVNLTSLQKLEIVSCPRLLSLPNGMQNLTALRELKIQKSPTLRVSCTQNWPNISRVPEVHLD